MDSSTGGRPGCPALNARLNSTVVTAQLVAWTLFAGLTWVGPAVADPERARMASTAAVQPSMPATSRADAIEGQIEQPPASRNSDDRRQKRLKKKTKSGSPQAALAGKASVYGGGRHRGSRTANGEQVQPGLLTAAHRTLPFGTAVRVTNLRNGRSVVVRINDRGPFIRGRVIDVTPAAARALGFSGLAAVSLAVVAGAAP